MDDKIVKRVGVEEELIKFRPSPNFKNMKKFLKNRSDYTEPVPLNNHHVEVEQHNCEKTDRKEIKPVVQPPLPPYPPPPDSPPHLNVTIKQERVDEDEQRSPVAEDNLNPVTATQEAPAPLGQHEQRPKKTICKEFIRGNCKRAVCKFAHEVDVSQLAGVFTFCWNYQNAVCTFPSCRFVHASVFEEAEFYRTGILPPHARSHLKKEALPTPEDAQRGLNFNNHVGGPPLVTGVDKPTPIISCVPASNLEPRPDDFSTPLPRSISPRKRDWTDVDKFGSSPRDLETNVVKKCKKCELREFSLEYNKDMIENLIQSSEELNKKMSQLNKKNTKLLNVLLTLLKPPASNKTLLNNAVISNEKDKSIMEQLNNLVCANNRLSSINNDDSLKNLVGGNINLSNLMAKLFSSNADQPISSDTTIAKCS